MTKIILDLPDEQAEALAQMVKRFTWDDAERFANRHDGGRSGTPFLKEPQPCNARWPKQVLHHDRRNIMPTKAKGTKIEDWTIHSAYSMAAMLPTKRKEAFAVLDLVRELVEKRPLQHRLRKPPKHAAKPAAEPPVRPPLSERRPGGQFSPQRENHDET
jgi:hypothetical protein